MTRPVVQELQELYELAIREHGPQARSVRMIGEVLQRELRGDARKTNAGMKGAAALRKEGPGS